MGSLLSIDIGKKNIHIVEGSFQKGNLQIDKVASFKVSDGTFNGETVNNKGLLSENISNSIQNAGFDTKEAIVTFDAYGAVIRDIVLPIAKPKEIAEMIKTEMIETYHILPTDVIQFKSIEKEKNEPGNQLMNYRAAAIDVETVEAYHNILLEAKLKPIVMDININTIDKLISGEFTINDKIINGNATMLIDFGATLTTIYIVAKDKSIFYRHLDAGSGDIERIISEETFSTEDDIRKMKEDGFNFFGKDESSQKYFTILRPFIYNLTDEIRKIIGFYTSRSNISNIDQIFLFGGGSSLAGLAEHFENNFGVPTEQIINISKVKFKDSATPIALYMNAIGALIRY